MGLHVATQPGRWDLQGRFAAEVPRLWYLLTDPEGMNEWSSARVTLVAPGAGGRSESVGALREVAVASVLRLLEVVEASRFPQRFVYRVVPCVWLRSHRGEIALAPEAGGTCLRWTIDFESMLPGLGWLAGAIVLPQLVASLERLERVAADAPPGSTPPQVAFEVADIAAGLRGGGRGAGEHDRECAPLWERANATLEKQRQLADSLQRQANPNWLFARAYEYVTENQLAACAAAVNHAEAEWVLHLIPIFHRYYVLNLDRWLSGPSHGTEPHWRAAFAVAEELPWKWNPLLALGRSVQAHIEEDLPRALAELQIEMPGLDLRSLRPSYIGMTRQFFQAADRLLREILPLSGPLSQRILPAAMRELLIRFFFYDIPAKRDRAFDRAIGIAALLDAQRRQSA